MDAASSTSHDVQQHVRDHTPSILKDNAPRVVSALKIAGSAAMIASKNWAFRVAGSCFIAGNLLMMAFGHKKSDAEREEMQKKEADDFARHQIGDSPVRRHIYKVLHPKQYPLESGLTIFNLGSIFWLLAGAVGGEKNSSKWYLIGGGLSLASDANGAFRKEKLDDTAERAGKGPLTSLFIYLKNRPVLGSSLLNIGADVTTTVGGAIKFMRKDGDPRPMIAGGLILLANLFQAMFVNRNDYNIEKKQGAEKTEEPVANIALPEASKTRISQPQHEGIVAATAAKQIA